MSTYLSVYFAICALSMSIVAVERSSQEEWWRFPIHVILSPIVAPFAVLWLHVGLPISDKLDGFFQAKTWWRLAFNRKSLMKTTEELENLARMTRAYKMTNHPGHVGWRLAFRAICKLNNYTFEP